MFVCMEWTIIPDFKMWGFKTKAIDFLKDLRPEEKRRFALPEAEKIPVATK